MFLAYEDLFLMSAKATAGDRSSLVSSDTPVGGPPLDEGLPPFGRRKGSPPARDDYAVRERCARADSLRSFRNKQAARCDPH